VDKQNLKQLSRSLLDRKK